MWNVNYRDLNTIRAKLALLAAASIVDYEKVNAVKRDDCYEATINVKPNLFAWLFIDFDGDATLEIDDSIYAAYTGGNRLFRLSQVIIGLGFVCQALVIPVVGLLIIRTCTWFIMSLGPWNS